MNDRHGQQCGSLLKRQFASFRAGDDPFLSSSPFTGEGRVGVTTPSFFRPGAGTRGFSLVELLVAIFITGIIAGSIYTMYVNFFKTSHSQDILLEAQQNARVAINMMEREILNAGYIAGTADILTVNTDASQVEFLYTDPADPGVRLKVHYALATAGGVTYLTRKADNVTTGAAGNTEQVIPNAQSLAFLYYDKDGNAVVLTGASTQAQRNTVRYVDVKLVTAVPERFLGAVAYSKTFTVQTHMNIRNLGIGQIALDATAPATPTGLQVRDPGVCGRLKAKWTRNTDGDLAGYKLYYGAAPGNYTGVINIPKSVLSGTIYSCTQDATYITCTIFPKEKDPSTGAYTSTDTLMYTPSTTASGAGTKYYLAVEAYDASYNYSSKTADAFGDPDPSNSDFGAAGNDSTINPVKPPVPTGFTATDGPSDGQVKLSWTAYNTSAYPDVVGFRIYRSDASFSSVPVDVSQWIEGETASGIGTSSLAKTATTYTDSNPSLLACKVYNYAIAAVNCDATLIPDNGGDTAAKKYGWTDYAATCGDGSAACSPGTSFAAVTGSDTAPPKSTGPNEPAITARAGWRRVAVTLTQPSDTDLDQTCAYADTAGYPTLNTLTAPLASDQIKCYPATTGIRVADPYIPPGYNGIFKAINDPADPLYMGLNYYLARSTPTTFWHSSMTAAPDAPTSAPSLADVATYYYKAVSFNRCGKPSTTNTSFAVTTLCFEDPPVCPALDPDGYCQPDFGGKPPAVDAASIMVGCCDTDPTKRDSVTHLYPATISWTGITSSAGLSSRQNNPYDLAGYRIFKNKNNSDWSASTLITATANAPMWGTSTSDTELSDAETNSDGFGGVYYYRIVTTDCPYEKVNPTAATIRTDMLGLGTAQLQSSVSPVVYPGKIDRTKKCAGALPCTKAATDHREVVTGVDVSATNAVTPHRDTATAPYTSSFDYSHNTVTMFFNNTSAGTMTITDATVEWINVSAYLTKITIGGGRSGIGALSTAFVNGDTIDFTNSPAPFTRGIALKTLTPAQIPAWSTGEYVPITFEFKDINGKPIDMRDDSLYVTLKAANDLTGTSGSAGCVSYLTISQLQETSGVYIPLGPSVTSVSRNKPSSPTFDLAYPGSTGLNTVPVTGSGGTEYAPNPVVGGVSVTVSANIVSSTTSETTGLKIDISSAEVHYVETAITVAAAPALSDAAWSDSSKSGTVAMTGAASGGIWTGAIPSRVTTGGAKRVWYYVVAFDSDGNYDRLPKTTDGYYVYDQKPISVCDYTPSGVTTLEQWTTNFNTNVYFRWPAVTTYTNGNTIDTASDPIYYQVWRQTDTAAFQMVYKVKHSTTGCVWIASGSETYTSPVTAATGTLSPTSTAYYAECDGSPNLYYWREDRGAGATDFANQVVSWYVVPQNSCSANGNAGAASNTFKECVGSSTATIQVTPSSIQYGDANTFSITVSDCSKVNGTSGQTITDMVKLCSANLNAANCVGNSTYTTAPTYFTPYTITETLDSGVFTKTGAIASTTNTSGKVYVNPIGNTTTEKDTVYVSCPTCSGPPAPVTLTVKSLACDRTPSAPTGVQVSRPTSGSDTVDVSWTARTEWDMAAGQTPTAAKYDIYRAQVTKTGSTCAACPAAGSLTYLNSKSDGTVTYADTTASQGSGSSKKCYCYLVKAVDSCPLTSNASSVVGPL